MKQLLRYDMQLQWRQGFWFVYFIVTFLYLIILFNINNESRLYTSLLFILSDTSVLGVMFVGALLLLEKQQNVLQSLFVTPLKVRQYLASKTISLTFISLIMSILLYILPNGINTYFLIILVVVIANSIIFTLLGLGLSIHVDTINKYLGLLVSSSLVIILPVVPFILFDYPFWLLIFPMNAALDLVSMGINEISNIRIITNIIILIIWIFLAYAFARKQFEKVIYR